MALISIDPFAWIDAIRRTTKLFEWVKTWSALLFAGISSFLTGCGTSLIAHRPNAEAVGSGMVLAAVGMTATWRRMAPKGTSVVLPESEAQAELEQSSQVISK